MKFRQDKLTGRLESRRPIAASTTKARLLASRRGRFDQRLVNLRVRACVHVCMCACVCVCVLHSGSGQAHWMHHMVLDLARTRWPLRHWTASME